MMTRRIGQITLRRTRRILLVLIGSLLLNTKCWPQAAQNDLKLVLIRHAEKPPKGDNLTCQGLNRSLQLPALLYSRVGIPAYVYIPALGLGESTIHARMFQTIIPFAVKYNLALNSTFSEKDSAGLAADILGTNTPPNNSPGNNIPAKKGTVLIVWEHKCIPSIARALGIKDVSLHWDDDDYDSLWIINVHNGIAELTIEKEGLHPSAACAF